MAEGTTLEFSEETLNEMPMVDLAYELLSQSAEPLYYRDLTKQIAKIKGLSEEEMLAHMAQLYTEINIDGRFICVGRSLWGIKERYTMEQATDAAVAASVQDDIDEYELEEDDDDEMDMMEEDDSIDVDREEED